MDESNFSFGEPEGSSGAATMVRPSKAPAKERERREIPRFNVVLWDSDDHTFEYVGRMLRELFGHTQLASDRMVETVDSTGRAIVYTTHKEHAELKRDQIHAYGRDPESKDCKGSMSATIEEAE